MDKFEIPKDIKGLDLDALRGLLADARAHGRSLIEGDDVTEEQIAEAEKVMAFMETVESAITEFETAEANKATALDAARGAFAEPEGEEGDEDDDEDEPVEVEPEAEKVAVAASAKPSAARAVAKTAAKPKAPAPKKELNIITASADVPGFNLGQDIDDLDGLGLALQARLGKLPTNRIGGQAGTQNRYGVGQFNLGAAREDGLYQGNRDFRDDQELVMAASKEARLKGGSLVAAGTWCSPSETLYGFCSEESTDGILDLPSITANRGGVRFTKGPDFAAIYANANLGWSLTEAQVIAESPAKTAIDVECPAFTDVRLDAIGLAIRAGILTNATYPELVRRYIEAALIAHQHKVAGRMYTAIVAGSATRSAGTPTLVMDSIAQLEVVGEYERQRKRMAFNTTLEVLLPVWYKAVVRADLARRNGVEAWNVTDQQIEAIFAVRKMRVQWLYNTGQDIISTGGALALPGATVQAVMYPAGTWVKATTDVISLDAVYDSTNIMTNTYTALFVEEGAKVLNTCGDSVKVNLSYDATGQTGAADLTTQVIPGTA